MKEETIERSEYRSSLGPFAKYALYLFLVKDTDLRIALFKVLDFGTPDQISTLTDNVKDAVTKFFELMYTHDPEGSAKGRAIANILLNSSRHRILLYAAWKNQASAYAVKSIYQPTGFYPGSDPHPDLKECYLIFNALNSL